VRRGEIWWTALNTPIGSEPGYRRPMIIVSSNTFNDSGYRTVLMVPLTSNMARESAPGNVRLASRKTGLPKNSVAITSQVTPTDKSRLLERIGRVPDDLISDIDEGLRLVLAL
jgi:mRNA interferase MazF